MGCGPKKFHFDWIFLSLLLFESSRSLLFSLCIVHQFWVGLWRFRWIFIFSGGGKLGSGGGWSAGAAAPLRRNPNFFSANFEFFLFYSYFSLLVLSPKFSKQTRFKFRSKKKKENFYTSFWFGFSLNGVDLVPLRWDPFASLCFDAPCGFELKSVWVWYMVGSVMTSLMWVFWCWDVMSYCYTCLLVWLCRFMVNFWLWVCAFSGCFMNLFGPPSYDCWVCIL